MTKLESLILSSISELGLAIYSALQGLDGAAFGFVLAILLTLLLFCDLSQLVLHLKECKELEDAV